MTTRQGGGQSDITGGFSASATQQAGAQAYQVNATFAAAGGLSAFLNANMVNNATFAGAGGWSARANLNSVNNAATFAAAGGFSAGASLGQGVAATFAPVGSFSANVSLGQAVRASFAATASLSAAINVGLAARAQFDVSGGFNANISLGQAVSARFVGVGSFSANGTVFTPSSSNAWQVSATFVAAGGFSASITIAAQVSAVFAGVGSFSADGIYGQVLVLGDLTLIENQALEGYGEHDIYASGITQVYLLLSQPSPENPQMIFERPDASTFTLQPPYVTVGAVSARTSKGSAIAGQYLVASVNSSEFNRVGVWRCFAKTDGVGASFYVRH